MQRTLRATLVCATALSVMSILPTFATAQTTPTTSEPKAIETIVVTGSRIRRSAANAAAPLIQVTQESILNSGEANVIDYLADIPALQNSTVPEDTVGNLNTGGLSLLNLRDLGAARTLVLVDGRRHVGAPQGSLSVDVDTIPRLLQQSIEVITGGQSAVYGADAVSGVVNFIMKKDFEGLDADLAVSEINQGGQTSQRLSLLGGRNLFDNKLNIYLSAEWERNEEVRDGDVDWRRESWALIAADVDTAAAPSDGVLDAVLVRDLRNISRLYGGALVLAGNPRPSPASDPLIPFQTCSAGPLPAASTNFNFNFGLASAACFTFDANQNRTFLFNPDGTSRLPNYGTYQGQVGISRANNIGGDGLNSGTQFSQGSRVPGQNADRFQGGFNVKPTANIDIFGEVKYVKEDSYLESQPTFFDIGIAAPQAGRAASIWGTSSFNIGLDNPFLPANVRSAILANTRPVYDVNGNVVNTVADPRARLTIFGPIRDQINNREVTRYVFGGRGTAEKVGFVTDVSWDISFTAGESKNQNIERAVDTIRFAHATDVVVDTAGILGTLGANVCRVKLLVAQGVTVVDPRNALLGQTNPNYTASNPTVANCTPQRLFGVDMRQVGYNPAAEAYYGAQIAVKHTNKQEDLLATVSGNLWDFWGAGPIGFALGYEARYESAVGVGRSRDTAGRLLFLNTGADFPASKYDTKEYFAEARLPLLKDSRFGKLAELSGAFRRSEYSTVGEQDTYSFQALYRPISSLLFRGSFGEAIRVPSLADAYSPLTQTFANGFVDPCDRLAINAQSAEVQGFRRANCAALLGPQWSGDPNTGTLITYTSGVPGLNGGNPLLTPETSRSVTGSIAWSPRFEGKLSVIKNLDIVFDYYKIEISDVIASVTMPVAAAACVSQAALNPSACSTIKRNGFNSAGDPNNFRVIDFIQGSINYARSVAEGVDYSMTFNAPLPPVFGLQKPNLQFSLRGNYNIKQDDYFNIALPNVSTAFDGTLERPRSRFASTVTLRPTEKLAISWDMDWQSTQQLLADPRILGTDTDNRLARYIKTGNFAQHDFSVRYNISEKVTLRAGVVNVLDAEPPRWLGSTTSSDNFDFWGRRVFIGLRYRG